MISWALPILVLASVSVSGAVLLPGGGSVQGVERAQVLNLSQGEDSAFPALAVTPAGEVLVAFVRLEAGRETIWLRKAESPRTHLDPARQVSRGRRAWHPRLAAGRDGTVWLVWSGLSGRVKRGSHEREVFLRRVHPGSPGPVVRVSGSKGRAADPELAVGQDGRVHLVWEQSAGDRMDQVRVAYRALSASGEFLAETEILSPGPFDRRPAVALSGQKVTVVWDSLVDQAPTGRADPDYDVFLRTRSGEGWGERLAVDTRPGIQAAPSLAVDRAGCLLVAYHSSHRYDLVKWWDLRRVCGRKLEALVARDPDGEEEPSGEQQGAEFPALAALSDGRLAVVSRPSQGAYLQLVDSSGISSPLNLTRRGWGARGMRVQAAPGPGGSLLAVRRARHGCVLERFSLAGESGSRPSFVGLSGAGEKPARTAVSKGSGEVLYGDPHMHSAASDGTGPPDEIYARAWVRGLDFAAITDHDYIIGSPRFPSSFDEIAWTTDAFDARQGFSTLHAYEWTTKSWPEGSGHRNVYFRGSAPSRICGSKNGCPDSKSLFAALRAERAVAIPHHTSWTGTDWENADPAIQTQFEIVSVHGASECPDNLPIKSRGKMAGMFARDGLKRGLVFGFVGGTDAHGLRWHHGIGRAMDPWSQGLTGVAAEPNRAAIFDAIQARRTFATSGIRRPVFLKAGSLPMGSQGIVAAPLKLTYRADGYRRIELLRDGKTIHQAVSARGKTAGVFLDADVSVGAHVYYLRAFSGPDRQAKDAAWTSPIFVTIKARGRNR